MTVPSVFLNSTFKKTFVSGAGILSLLVASEEGGDDVASAKFVDEMASIDEETLLCNALFPLEPSVGEGDDVACSCSVEQMTVVFPGETLPCTVLSAFVASQGDGDVVASTKSVEEMADKL